MNMLDYVNLLIQQNEVVTKQDFGKLVHSGNQEDVDKALEALEMTGSYDNLAD